MEMKMDEITINGKTYVEKGSISIKAEARPDGLEYCLVRTQTSGVFAGWFDRDNTQSGTIYDSRGIWYWDGACGLSQLATDGTTKPDDCKFTVRTAERDLKQIIEVIPCTDKAMKSIEGVKEWKK